VLLSTLIDPYSCMVLLKSYYTILQIKVLLPTKHIREGTLLHYNIHYNVALVSVKDFCSPHPMDIEHQRHSRPRQLVSVGRCIESGTLMAARGIHLNRFGRLDCKLLQYSTCKITKVLLLINIFLFFTAFTWLKLTYISVWHYNDNLSMAPG